MLFFILASCNIGQSKIKLWIGLSMVGVEAHASGVPCLFSEAITREVDICNVKFLSINNGTKPWVEEIKNTAPVHMDNSEYIKAANFDIDLETEKLTEFYMALNNKKNNEAGGKI